MKIKGVVKVDKGSKKKGDPVEYTPEEKPILAVKDAVIQSAKDGETWWAEKVTVSKMNFSPRELESKNKGFSSNAYSAEGSVVVRRLENQKDRYKRPEERKFKIQFEDCLDEMGMPDLKVTEFNFI